MFALDGGEWFASCTCHLAPRKEPPALINPLNTELNPICHFLALLGAYPILHVSRIRVK
jgi:hypothetical protein